VKISKKKNKISIRSGLPEKHQKMQFGPLGVNQMMTLSTSPKSISTCS